MICLLFSSIQHQQMHSVHIQSHIEITTDTLIKKFNHFIQALNETHFHKIFKTFRQNFAHKIANGFKKMLNTSTKKINKKKNMLNNFEKMLIFFEKMLKY